MEKVPKLNISYKSNNIQRLHTQVAYQFKQCQESRQLCGSNNNYNKINSRLEFLHRKNKSLTPVLRRLLCNSLIKSHFDHVSSAWYPILTHEIKIKVQIRQNKCIRYCLQLDEMIHISKNKFETLNWLPVKDRFNQSTNSIVLKYFILSQNCYQL